MNNFTYSQFTETEEAKLVLIHEPSYEIFMSMLHPAGSLYKDVTSESLIQKNFQNLKIILKAHGIKTCSVREILSQNREDLLKLSMETLHYTCDESQNDIDDPLFKFYLSDEYKKQTLNKMNNNQLVDIVLTNPFFELKYSKKNTYIETSKISFAPLGNLIYVRDPQIATQKGIVIGRSESDLRKTEKKIIYQVLKNINADIIGEIPENCFLEGGDFFTLRPDLAILGIGIRSNFEAAYYLMEKDLLGCEKLALCIDIDDLNQERMHLDTFFNVLDQNTVLVIDFDDLSKYIRKKINRKIQVFSKNKNCLNLTGKVLVENNHGEYFLVEEYNCMYEFLEKEKFEFIKCTQLQQENFIFNFLNIGNNIIIAINKELKELVKKNQVNVQVIDLDFDAIKNLYGGVRCATQVYRNIKLSGK